MKFIPTIKIIGDKSIPAPPSLKTGMYLLIGFRIPENNLSSETFMLPKGWVEGTSIQLKITHANKE